MKTNNIEEIKIINGKKCFEIIEVFTKGYS